MLHLTEWCLYHIISYHIISYHIISYHIISYHIISYHIISYHIISYHIVSYRIVSYRIIYFPSINLYSKFQLVTLLMQWTYNYFKQLFEISSLIHIDENICFRHCCSLSLSNFNNSAGISSFPWALLFFNFFSAVSNSSVVGASVTSCDFPFNIWLLLMVVKVTHSLSLLLSNNLLKCLTHLSSIPCSLLIYDASSFLHILTRDLNCFLAILISL